MKNISLKRILLIAVVVGVTVYIAVSSYAQFTAGSKKDSNNSSESSDSYSIFNSLIVPLRAAPIHIKAGEIDADITQVGIEADGSLGTPESWNLAGWFKKSVMPGETGNMIIDGHFDDNHGKPAAFWQLKNIVVGDKVVVTDGLNQNYTYQVVDSFLVDINDPERLKVLENKSDRAELTLITCGGVWLPGKSTYNKRLVVKATLIDTL